MPILLERERQTKEQLKAVFAYIRKKRDKEQQALAEIRAREEEEKRRKREEEKKKETVEDVKREIEKCEAKLEELKQEKHSLFQQFKKVLYEEDTKKQQERAAAALAAQQHASAAQLQEVRPFGHGASLPYNQFDKNTGRSPTMLPLGAGRGPSLLHAQQMPPTQPLMQQQLRPHLYNTPMYRQNQPTQDQHQAAEQHGILHRSQSFSEDLRKSSKFGLHSSTSDLDSQHKRLETNAPQHRPSQQPLQKQQAQQQPPQQPQLMYSQLGQPQQQGYSTEQLKYMQHVQSEQRYPGQQDSQPAGQPFQPQGAPQMAQQAHKHFQQHHQPPYHVTSQEQMYQQSPYPAQLQQPVHMPQNQPSHASGPFQVPHGYTTVLDSMTHQQQAQHYSSGQQLTGFPIGQQHDPGHSAPKLGLLPTPARSSDSSQRHGQQFSGPEDRPLHSERAKDKRGQDYHQSKRSSHKYSPYPSTKGHHQGGTPKKYAQGRHSSSQEGPSDRYKMKHSLEGPTSERYISKHAPEGSSSTDKYSGKHSASEGSAEAAEHVGSYSRHHHYHQNKGHKGSGSHSFSQPRQRYYQ